MRLPFPLQEIYDESENPYTADLVLPSLLRRLLPSSIRQEVEHDITRLGTYIVDDAFLLYLSSCDYDQWERRVDQLHTSEAWRKIEELAIREGFVSIAYERKYNEYSRRYSFVKVMTMTGDCHVVLCSLGHVLYAGIELSGTDEMKQQLLPRLISHDPSIAYLSGQWMTERPGGSDISQTETTAVPTSPTQTDLGTPCVLNGFKWFSSAAESNMAVALARMGTPQQGSRGLSLFAVPLRHAQHPTPLSNGVKIHRLKQKLGAHGVPTAELELEGTRAWLLGQPEESVKAIVTVLGITRMHSAVHSVGSLQGCLAIARSYARVRAIEGGKGKLCDVPLYVTALAEVSLLHQALTHVTFRMVVLLGWTQCGIASEDEERRLRLLTLAIKGYAAVRCPTVMEECMGSLGGLGYMEEVGIGRLIKDSLVERIWEGTVNILALDLVRATKDAKTIESYMKWAQALLPRAIGETSTEISPAAIGTLAGLVEQLPPLFTQNATNPLIARSVLNLFASVSCALFLLGRAAWAVRNGEATKEVDIEAFRRWVEEGDMEGDLRGIAALQKEWRRRAELDLKMVYGAGGSAGVGSKL
ncbi:hypothetical protein HETIRDRAFT_317913 [Heterobasidion irregulare TC 32-1]|uniref:Uncharacterized protein n=1 Tax=Heterobasidion irregulare (strain TC 32-1) TaxID=747525 RepID=W4KAY8_HETIT|nr:uncharacterized protein HETIRDRAFT_317913 [Heterobasidion irregulare TC 32-1]ETW82236.1 hypothetical protein HETIRDRAFT_317913 [Heterobasidion irregulare TC 32-1]